MANAGDTIRNPLTGERITFLQTTRDTNGELLRFEYLIPPGFSIPEHVHPHQEERHEVVSGILRGRVGGSEGTFVEGQRVTGPAGVPHAWRNPSDDGGLLIFSELRPALGFENVIETAFAIAGDPKIDKMGAPGHLLRLSMLLDGSREDFYPTADTDAGVEGHPGPQRGACPRGPVARLRRGPPGDGEGPGQGRQPGGGRSRRAGGVACRRDACGARPRPAATRGLPGSSPGNPRVVTGAITVSRRAEGNASRDERRDRTPRARREARVR